MKKIQKAFHLLFFNWKPLIGFELIYKLLSATVMAPMLKAVFHAAMSITGYHYLTTENIWNFLKHPVVSLAFLVFVIMVCLYCILDIGALIFLMDQSYHHQKVSLYQTACFTFQNLRRILKLENLQMVGWLFLIIPFLNMGVLASFVITVPIPEFMISHIRQSTRCLTIAVLLLTVLAWYLIRFIYVFHYFALEQCSFQEAKKRSKKLNYRRRSRDFFWLAMVQTMFYLSYAVFAAMAILFMVIFKQLFSKLHLFNMVTLSTVWGILIFILLIETALGIPFCFVCISMRYYTHREKREDRPKPCPAIPEPLGLEQLRKVQIIEWMLLAAAFLGGSYLVYSSSVEKLNPQIEYIRTMEVTAHRGASAYYPENTMAAFEGAVEMGTDWIELDVQQSRDGKIFVMHDRNFMRTAGVNEHVWNMDWAQIQKLDVGSHFGEEFKNERIPLLSEVIEFAKEHNTRLNIELKPSGHEVDFEKHVVDLVTEAEFLDSCVITSWNYETLERVKAYCEDVTTVYVMGIAIGNVNRLKAADHFSMEASNVTPAMVSRVHNAGKQLYAWTVNTRKSIRRMIDLNVDNIITDKVLLAQECIYEDKTTGLIQTYVDFLQKR